MHGERASGYTGRRSLSLMTTAERTQVLYEFNHTTATHSQDRLIHQQIEAQARQIPDAIAVVCEQSHLTYGDLDRKSTLLARYLRERGVGPDQPVGVCVERGLQTVVSLLAVLKAGGAYLPLDPNYPDDRLHYMLRNSAPRVLITQRHLKQRLPDSGLQVVTLDDAYPEIAERFCDAPDPDISGLGGHHLAYIIYTSGSTGDPKGVMIEHRNVTRLFAATAVWFEFGRADVWTLFHSFAFDFSVWELWGALLYGGRLVIVPYAISRSPQDFYRLVCEQGVTVLNQTPSAFAQLTDAQAQYGGRQHSLRLVIFGGEALEMHVLQSWTRFNGALSPRLVNMYGITETTVHVTYCPLADEEVNSERGGLIGRPIPDLQVYLLDRYREPVPIGVVGEIYVGGAGVARGYLGQPRLTSERFVADPFGADPAGRLYKSGDLARWRSDGTIEYVGRNDHQLKIRGFRIELGEIEAQLVRLAQLKDAVVVAREDSPGEKRLVAYLVLQNSSEPGQSLRAEAIRTDLKSRLPDYMLPSAYVILDRFPLTTHGKLDRRALPPPELEAYATSQYEVPQGTVERTLAGIWQDLLHIERVGRKDNFFALGGHSLQGVQLAAQIEQNLVAGLPPTAVFQYPTIQQMASAVSLLLTAHGQAASAMPIATDLRLERVPLTFSQLAHWNSYLLGERPAIRQIASATRLHGRLNIESLRNGLAALVRRHDALRVRIVLSDGIPTQEIQRTDDIELQCSDVQGLSKKDRETEVCRTIEQLVLESIDPAIDPLVAVRLLKIQKSEHVLIVAMEHMISDAVSMNILLRDLLSAYAQSLQGRTIDLPNTSLQFPEYAVWQKSNHSLWLQKHGAYWDCRQMACQRVKFPADKSAPEGDGIGWGTIPVRIGAQMKAELREWCRSRHTTLALSVLTAYIGSVVRWCSASRVVVVYQTDGRSDPRTQNTIGYLAAPLYLDVEVLEDDRFIDLLHRVTAEYVVASGHTDFFFIESRRPTPEFTRSSSFNWVSRGLEKTDIKELVGSPDAITSTPIAFEHPILRHFQRDIEPFILLHEGSEEVIGGLHFPRNRFSGHTMEKFTSQFLGFLEGMLRYPERRVSASLSAA